MVKTKAKKPPVKNGWPAEEIVRRKVSELIPYARNARTHDKAQVQQIAASIKEWGWTTPMLIDEDGMIIAGHGRILAAQMLSITEVPCMVARGWSDAQKQAYVIADNQLALNAEWDVDKLKLELGDLTDLDFDLDLIGFPDLELKGLFEDDAEIVEDEVPDVPDEPKTKPGDLWALGEHRVLCGDSTKGDDVARALDGATPFLMVTDPPYGVDYDPEWRNQLNGGTVRRRLGSVSNDDLIDWSAAYALFPGDVMYVWHAHQWAWVVAPAMRSCAFEIRAGIIWRKPQIVFGRGHYHWQHEPCYYAVRDGKTAKWAGDRKQSTVWDIQNLQNRRRDEGTVDDWTDYGTQKPVECMARPIRNHGEKTDAVYDPFLGSGTTLIAAEQLGRTCYGIEIEPRYVDVIVQRWENLTGKKATLVKAK